MEFLSFIVSEILKMLLLWEVFRYKFVGIVGADGCCSWLKVYTSAISAADVTVVAVVAWCSCFVQMYLATLVYFLADNAS